MSGETKVCSKCKIEKPLSEFHKQKSGKYGVHGWCKTCFSNWQKEHRYRGERKTPILYMTKICPICKTEKPILDFYKDKRQGIRPRCKSCSKLDATNWRKSKSIPKVKLTDIEKRERQNTYQREYRKTHKYQKNYQKETCNFLKKHHEELKDDPDHLSCDFLKKIIGVDCK